MLLLQHDHSVELAWCNGRLLGVATAHTELAACTVAVHAKQPVHAADSTQHVCLARCTAITNLNCSSCHHGSLATD